MGYLTTHVLDTALGIPGEGIEVRVYKVTDSKELIKTVTTNSDGRTDQPVLSEQEFELGTYELVFKVARYFSNTSLRLDDPAFLDEISLRFTMSLDDHYHVPLLVSPWSYSTYRGS